MLIQYIYCMDLTEEELPSQVEAVNLSQIGLVKYPKLPCNPLMVKVWLTSTSHPSHYKTVGREYTDLMYLLTHLFFYISTVIYICVAP